MTYAVVTGAAGFIGSHLVDALLSSGGRVLGVDALTDYYDPEAKKRNLAEIGQLGTFEFRALDLRTADLAELLAGADVVFHLAGQPGVRGSFAEGFSLYVEHNILVTQRLLEAARAAGTRRIVFASSSSVYGNADHYPTGETTLPRPYSPYGVTKLAAEHLCSLYAANWGLPTLSLRYFSVYGPRQRPDMAMSRLVDSTLNGTPFPLFGNGAQVRDFTFVADVVAATVAAAAADAPPGTVLNVAGGSSASMNEVIDLIGALAGRQPVIERMPSEPGDVQRTGGSIDLAKAVLGWEPATALRDGLASQIAWARRFASGDGQEDSAVS